MKPTAQTMEASFLTDAAQAAHRIILHARLALPALLLATVLLLAACGRDDVVEKSAAPQKPASKKSSEAGSGRGHPMIPLQVIKVAERSWRTIAADGIHDPANPSVALLQEPAEALSVLPKASEGNQVDWVAALSTQAIAPRTNVFPETNIQVLDLDIMFEDTAGMPLVLFPHRQHTEWLDCSNCHNKIFKQQQGANDVGMLDVLQGEYCGQCHGAVSFPLTQCFRCHSVDRKSTAKALAK